MSEQTSVNECFKKYRDAASAYAEVYGRTNIKDEKASLFREELEAAETLARVAGVTPRRCMHHSAYPDSDGYCMGEPGDYCESLADAGRRVARCMWSEQAHGDEVRK